MPIYEYRCLACHQVSSFFTRSIGSPLEPVCGYCQGTDLQRRMSLFVTGKTAPSMHQDSPAEAGLDYYSDPRNIGRHVEEGFSRYGMEVPPSVRETIDAARGGHLPEELDS